MCAYLAGRPCNAKRVAWFLCIAFLTLPSLALAKYESNKPELKKKVEEGGWTVAWSDDISETDAAQGLVAAGISLYAANGEPFVAWVESLVARNIASLKKEVAAAFPDEAKKKAIELASKAIKEAIKKKDAKEITEQFGNIDFKAGIIKYSGRNYKKVGSKKVTISETWGLKPYVAFRLREVNK